MRVGVGRNLFTEPVIVACMIYPGQKPHKGVLEGEGDRTGASPAFLHRRALSTDQVRTHPRGCLGVCSHERRCCCCCSRCLYRARCWVLGYGTRRVRACRKSAERWVQVLDQPRVPFESRVIQIIVLGNVWLEIVLLRLAPLSLAWKPSVSDRPDVALRLGPEFRPQHCAPCSAIAFYAFSRKSMLSGVPRRPATSSYLLGSYTPKISRIAHSKFRIRYCKIQRPQTARNTP